MVWKITSLNVTNCIMHEIYCVMGATHMVIVTLPDLPCVLLRVGARNSDASLSHRKSASTNKPVAFRSVHTGIELPFLLKIYYAITAYVTRSFTSRKY